MAILTQNMRPKLGVTIIPGTRTARLLISTKRAPCIFLPLNHAFRQVHNARLSTIIALSQETTTTTVIPT